MLFHSLTILINNHKILYSKKQQTKNVQSPPIRFYNKDKTMVWISVFKTFIKVSAVDVITLIIHLQNFSFHTGVSNFSTPPVTLHFFKVLLLSYSPVICPWQKEEKGPQIHLPPNLPLNFPRPWCIARTTAECNDDFDYSWRLRGHNGALALSWRVKTAEKWRALSLLI